MLRIFLGLNLLFAVGTLACTSDENQTPEEQPGRYVGSIAGSDAVVGLVTEEDRLMMYVCGGASTYATYTHWFKGPLDSSSFSLAAAGWTLSGTLQDGAWAGDLVPPQGETLTWSSHRVSTGTLEGLYHVMDSNCRTGVVIQETTPGTLSAQGAWCDDAGHISQVIPILPVAMTERGIPVRVDLSEGVKDLFVQPLELPPLR